MGTTSIGKTVYEIRKGLPEKSIFKLKLAR